MRSLAEASKLHHGDIMVCEMTLPPWVPLFSIAGAVVTDTGGVLRIARSSPGKWAYPPWSVLRSARVAHQERP